MLVKTIICLLNQIPVFQIREAVFGCARNRRSRRKGGKYSRNGDHNHRATYYYNDHGANNVTTHSHLSR